MFCPAMCSGKGICNWDAKPYPVCECNDKSDTSAGCYNSSTNYDDNSASSIYSISLFTILVTFLPWIVMMG